MRSSVDLLPRKTGDIFLLIKVSGNSPKSIQQINIYSRKYTKIPKNSKNLTFKPQPFPSPGPPCPV